VLLLLLLLLLVVVVVVWLVLALSCVSYTAFETHSQLLTHSTCYYCSRLLQAWCSIYSFARIFAAEHCGGGQ
jgi:hypothetical protein